MDQLPSVSTMNKLHYPDQPRPEPQTSSIPSLHDNVTVRRSIRPKPPVESLMSSPPAIKFYESTVIRKSTTERSVKVKRSSLKAMMKPLSPTHVKQSSSNTQITMNAPVSPTSTRVLKLRMPSMDTTLSTSQSKENLATSDSKRNLRVIKLMMPDSSDATEEVVDEPSRTKVKSPVKVLPLLAPKPTVPAGIFNESKPLDKKRSKNSDKVKSRKKEDVAVANVDTRKSSPPCTPCTPTSIPTIPAKRAHIVNEDICHSCGGLGNFICCDACPRSFHFTCADPPLDPLNLPESDWFCSQCLYACVDTAGTDDASAGALWGVMLKDARRSNPKCFVMPRRFRYQPKDEDLLNILNNTLIKSAGGSTANTLSSNTLSTNALSTHTNILAPTQIVINESIYLDHCGIKAPNISVHKASTGYCHHCGLYGLTRTALSNMYDTDTDDPHIPHAPQLHRPIMSCSICPLYWHLDCLDPPLPAYPKPSTVATWTCPIHFTTEHCLALDLAEALVQATMLLPESAIRLQFERKAERCRDGALSDVAIDQDQDEFELGYGIGDTISVPSAIKSIYQ